MQDLIALMQAGDAAALDRVARAYGPRLLAVARRCCRSPDDAEDAVQHALTTAHTAMRGYRGEGSPVAWLATLVARSCYAFNRSAHNDPARTLHVDVEPCTCDTPEAQAERAEVADALGRALMTLTRTDRLLFLLAAEGFTGDALAARFSLTPDAVRGRLKRARKTLRVALVHEGIAATPAHEVGAAADSSRWDEQLP